MYDRPIMQHSTSGITGLCLPGLVSTITQLQRYQNRLETFLPRCHQNSVSPWYKNNVLFLTSAIFI